MAEVLDDYPAIERPPKRRYPWDEWTDGRRRRLIQGEDYDAATDPFRNRLYTLGSRRNLEASTVKEVVRDGKWIAVKNGAEVGEAKREDGSPYPDGTEALTIQFKPLTAARL